MHRTSLHVLSPSKLNFCLNVFFAFFISLEAIYSHVELLASAVQIFVTCSGYNKDACFWVICFYSVFPIRLFLVCNIVEFKVFWENIVFLNIIMLWQKYPLQNYGFLCKILLFLIVCGLWFGSDERKTKDSGT